METKIINVAKDFSRYPHGRHKKYSHTSGERFRADLLIPLLEDNIVIINFTGVEGVSSGFLEEVFGGLVRLGYNKEGLLKRIKIGYEGDPSVAAEVKQYIMEADYVGTVGS